MGPKAGWGSLTKCVKQAQMVKGGCVCVGGGGGLGYVK